MVHSPQHPTKETNKKREAKNGVHPSVICRALFFGARQRVMGGLAPCSHEMPWRCGTSRPLKGRNYRNSLARPSQNEGAEHTNKQRKQDEKQDEKQRRGKRYGYGVLQQGNLDDQMKFLCRSFRCAWRQASPRKQGRAPGKSPTSNGMYLTQKVFGFCGLCLCSCSVHGCISVPLGSSLAPAVVAPGDQNRQQAPCCIRLDSACS